MVSARCSCYQFSRHSCTMCIFHTDDRALHSGKSTKQNAHKRVLALDIQSLMNTFGFNEKTIYIYEGGLEPTTLEMLDKCSTTRPLKHTSSQ